MPIICLCGLRCQFLSIRNLSWAVPVSFKCILKGLLWHFEVECVTSPSPSTSCVVCKLFLLWLKSCAKYSANTLNICFENSSIQWFQGGMLTTLLSCCLSSPLPTSHSLSDYSLFAGCVVCETFVKLGLKLHSVLPVVSIGFRMEW